jgi:hypothetical protein
MQKATLWPSHKQQGLSLGRTHSSRRSGSLKAKGRKPKSCLDWFFLFKIDRFAITKEVDGAQKRSCLKLRTRLRFYQKSFRLSKGMTKLSKGPFTQATFAAKRRRKCLRRRQLLYLPWPPWATWHKWTNFSYQDKTWAESSTLDVTMCMSCTYHCVYQYGLT